MDVKFVYCKGLSNFFSSFFVLSYVNLALVDTLLNPMRKLHSGTTLESLVSDNTHNVDTTLPCCSTLIMNSLTIGVRHECAATFRTATSLHNTKFKHVTSMYYHSWYSVLSVHLMSLTFIGLLTFRACVHSQCIKHSLLGKIVARSTQNQKRIVGRGCFFGRVGLVIDQQWVVDLVIKNKIKNHCPNFSGKKLYFYCTDILGKNNNFLITRISVAP